jgi:type IV pilus assembly protein PilK
MTQHWSYAASPEFDDRQFGQWRELLERRVGMQLPDQRRSFIQTNLNIRMREVGFSDYQSYYNHVVESAQGIAEWSVLVDRFTVQETRFFRDVASFKLVERYLEKRKQTQKLLNLWSVGCATGEEPYSLAMIAHDVLNGEKNFSVTATDVSLPVLAKARAASYHMRKFAQIPVDLQNRFFDYDADRFQIKPFLKSRVAFARLNVVELERSPLKDFDVIYCQNLLIYFRRWRRKDIANHLAERLAPGGMLILGSGEVTDWVPQGLTRVRDDHSLAFIKLQKQGME